MRLLHTEYEAEFQDAADAAFRYECTTHPDHYARISPKVERTHAIWTQRPMDLYVPDAREFIHKADKLFA